nr:hypothetical protein [Tanacetum cinerariifolium]
MRLCLLDGGAELHHDHHHLLLLFQISLLLLFYPALTVRKSDKPLHSHRLALRYTSHHLDHFTSESSLTHSSSGNSIIGHSLSRHTPSNTTDADSSTPLRFVHPSPARTPQCSETYLCWRSTSLSTIYPSWTSDSSAGDSSFESSARPSRKRCRYSVEEDIDTDVLEDIEADATAVEVTIDRDFKAGIDAGIGIEFDVGIDVEDEVDDEVESSDRGTMEVGVDVVARIGIPDGMLMLDAVEHLEQVEEGLQDIYDHVIEIPLQRIEDIETGQRELEAKSMITGGERASLLEQVASLERSNIRLRDTVMMERARADRFRRCVRFIEKHDYHQFWYDPEAIKELVYRRVEEALAAYEATRAANALEAENQSQNSS